MLLGPERLEVEHVPIVHSCTWQGCGVLTMGEYCIEHEHQDQLRVVAPARRSALDRFGKAAAVVAVAVAAGLVRMRVLR
jgi:hypothetical protein